MNNLCKIFTVIILLFSLKECFAIGLEFNKTQSDMLNISNASLIESDKKFEGVCVNIIDNFKSDNAFVRNFKKNIAEYLKYRVVLNDTILPSKTTDLTVYGSNYSIYSNSYLIELNEAKIEEYKRMVQLYCLYNDGLQPKNACSKKHLKNLFK